MSSFVSSILHSSANKIESVSFGSKKNKSKQQQQQQGDVLGSRLAMHASTPTLSNNTYYYHHPQRSHSTEYVPAAPPPYDTQLNLHHSSPVPSPSTSWTSEMSAFAEKIKDDVASSFKSTSSNKKSASSSAIDRHSISQGMKLVSIAADEYEQGNESVALGIYLTGIDKILMALPNKTDMNTKMAIREKLLDVEERVGIINLATTQKKQQQQQQQNNQPEDYSGKNIMTNTFLLSRIASTISTISTKAYQSTLIETNNENTPTVVLTSMPNVPMDTGDAMTKFKRFGQYVIQTTVTCAVLIKRSPLPDILSFLFGYLFQLMIWVDSEYHIMQKAQATSIKCLKFGLQANEQYRLHEFISEGLYMIFAAGLKATVAFNETPAYDVKQQPAAVMNVAPERVDPPKTCLPTVSQKAKSSPWVWSPW